MPSIIMVHHLYPLVPDRTLVDRQLEEYRKKKKVIMLKIGVEPGDHSIIVRDEFLQQLEIAKNRIIDDLAKKAKEAAAPSPVSSPEKAGGIRGRLRRRATTDDADNSEPKGGKDPLAVFDSLGALVKREVLDVSIGKTKLMETLPCDERDITSGPNPCSLLFVG